jgi:acetyl-CoA C-acetyltransferase
MIEDPVVIIGASRTPLGGFGGDLASLSAPELGAIAISDAITKSGIKITDVNEVIMGVVLPAGQGQAPARQASIGAGIPKAVGATTINKMCGSGMKAAMLAHDNILSGAHDIMVAASTGHCSCSPFHLPP